MRSEERRRTGARAHNIPANDAEREMKQEQVRLVEAAVKLELSYNQTLRWILLGRLKGEQRDGRWFVDAVDLERVRGERAATKHKAG